MFSLIRLRNGFFTMVECDRSPNGEHRRGMGWGPCDHCQRWVTMEKNPKDTPWNNQKLMTEMVNRIIEDEAGCAAPGQNMFRTPITFVVGAENTKTFDTFDEAVAWQREQK